MPAKNIEKPPDDIEQNWYKSPFTKKERLLVNKMWPGLVEYNQIDMTSKSEVYLLCDLIAQKLRGFGNHWGNIDFSDESRKNLRFRGLLAYVAKLGKKGITI